MKWLICFSFGLLLAGPICLRAQQEGQKRPWPITLSVFSESVSLPNFRGFFQNPNWGLRVGSEFYYGRQAGHQWLQTVNLGYYRHNGLQQGLYVSSEIGYRRQFGGFFADATIGVGYLHLLSALARYRPSGDGYQPAPRHLHKIMPTAGLGLGYQWRDVAFFTRFELFGEIPFSYGGSPVLPHQSLHLGTRLHAFK